jgi:hypothetical protein
MSGRGSVTTRHRERKPPLKRCHRAIGGGRRAAMLDELSDVCAAGTRAGNRDGAARVVAAMPDVPSLPPLTTARVSTNGGTVPSRVLRARVASKSDAEIRSLATGEAACKSAAQTFRGMS